MFISRRAGLGIAGAAVYVALASWAKLSYVDPAPKEGLSFQLHGPFVLEGGLAWRAELLSAEIDSRLTDEMVIYEDHRRLDRADNFRDLSKVPGRFLHERGMIWFSVVGDPNRNGLRYWAIIPDK
jgi:hypothetical protein